MQEYGKIFAEVYSRKWKQFSAVAAPKVQAYYEKTAVQPIDRVLLDLCCGTGEFCGYFLEHGYSVVGVDRSRDMLRHARELNGSYVASGKAEFIEADVTEYSATNRYGLVVSLYDSLNHLDSMRQLKKCFLVAKRALRPGGQFVFDLNTAAGLKRWVGIDMQEDEDMTLVRRGIYEIGMERAFTQITGYVRRKGDLFEKFSEVFYNTVFALGEVQEALESSGFDPVRIVSAMDLEQSVENPEGEPRVVFIARA